MVRGSLSDDEDTTLYSYLLNYTSVGFSVF
jgi:hypothetical protein